MRGAVILADVGLDLDDPAGDPAQLGVVGDELAAEQVWGGLEGGALEALPGER
jgi:hypothetical protein